MKALRHEETLLCYDGEDQLFWGRDRAGTGYLCLAVDDSCAQTLFLCAPITHERFEQLKNDVVDLRDIYTSPETGQLYTLQLAAGSETHELHEIDRASVTEEWLPAAGGGGYQ